MMIREVSMAINNSSIIKYLSLTLLPFAVAGCDNIGKVSYAGDVRPILVEHCIDCHSPGGEGYAESKYSMVSYEEFMKGTKYGPMVVPGDVVNSNIVRLIEGKADPKIHMPRGEHGRLADKEIATVKKWIEQGALKN